MSTQDGGSDGLGQVKTWLDEKINDNSGQTTEPQKKMYEKAKEWVDATVKEYSEADEWEKCYYMNGGKYWFFRKKPGTTYGSISPELMVDMHYRVVTLYDANGNVIQNPTAEDIEKGKVIVNSPYTSLTDYCWNMGDKLKRRKDNYRIYLKLKHILGDCYKSANDKNLRDDENCHRYVKPGKWYIGKCKKIGNDGVPTERPLICLDLTTNPVMASVVTRDGSHDLSWMTYGEFHKYYKKIYKESLWEKFRDHMNYCANKPRIGAVTMPGTKSDTFLKILGCAITPFMALYEGVKSGCRALKEMNSEIDGPKEKMPVSDNDSEDLKNAIKDYNDEVEEYNKDLPRILRQTRESYRFEDLTKAKSKLEDKKKKVRRLRKVVTNQQPIMTTNTVNPAITTNNTP